MYPVSSYTQNLTQPSLSLTLLSSPHLQLWFAKHSPSQHCTALASTQLLFFLISSLLFSARNFFHKSQPLAQDQIIWLTSQQSWFYSLWESCWPHWVRTYNCHAESLAVWSSLFCLRHLHRAGCWAKIFADPFGQCVSCICLALAVATPILAGLCHIAGVWSRAFFRSIFDCSPGLQSEMWSIYLLMISLLQPSISATELAHSLFKQPQTSLLRRSGLSGTFVSISQDLSGGFLWPLCKIQDLSWSDLSSTTRSAFDFPFLVILRSFAPVLGFFLLLLHRRHELSRSRTSAVQAAQSKLLSTARSHLLAPWFSCLSDRATGLSFAVIALLGKHRPLHDLDLSKRLLGPLGAT